MPELVNCPHCSKKLRIPEHLLGRPVKCPGCGNMFKVSADGGEQRPAEEQQPRAQSERFLSEPPPRDAEDEERESDRPRPRFAEDDDDYDDYEEGRRRYRRRERRRRAAVQDAVNVPAILLMVVGGLAIVVGIANLAVTISGFGIDPQDRANPAHMTGRYFGAGIGPVWGIVVALGGLQMKTLRSRGLAMTGAIFSLVPCSICCVFGLPVGIWALIVLNKPEVRDAFS
jgi:hypothetical protein